MTSSTGTPEESEPIGGSQADLAAQRYFRRLKQMDDHILRLQRNVDASRIALVEAQRVRNVFVENHARAITGQQLPLFY